MPGPDRITIYGHSNYQQSRTVHVVSSENIILVVGIITKMIFVAIDIVIR